MQNFEKLTPIMRTKTDSSSPTINSTRLIELWTLSSRKRMVIEDQRYVLYGLQEHDQILMKESLRADLKM